MTARAYIGAYVARWGAIGPLPRTRDLFANSKKNYIRVLSPVAWATGPLSPLGRATGGIFENFQNGHIFLKFLFF